MSPTDARRAMLRAEMERDWEMVVAQLALARTVEPSAGAPEAALVALSLDHAYQAFENVLVRLERALGLPARTGSDWHLSLLADAVLSVAGLRPALFPAEVERDWDELRRFRHFLRHAYPLDLDPHRLARNLEHLERAIAGTNGPLRAVLQALE
jgi:hypothetical protein